MTSIADQSHPGPVWQTVRIVGQIAAYAAVPISLSYGPAFSVAEILVPLYLIAAIGFLAILRGTVMPPLLMVVAYVCFGWYAVLLAIDVFHGGPFHFPLSYRANLLASNFILLAFPFFVIGLREVRVDMRIVEWAIIPSIVFVACLSVYQFVAVDIERPQGLVANPIPFALMCAIWSLCLLARALSTPSIGWIRLGAALVGLVPVALSGSKLVWLAALLSYAGLFVAWAQRNGRWAHLLGVTLLLVPAGWLLYQADFVRIRLLEFDADFGSFLTSGDMSGASFGQRFAAARAGLRAFLDCPLLGYGMTDAKLAAVEHQLPGEASFGRLFHLHNEYVTFLVAFGIAGLLFVLTLIAAFIVAARRNTDIAMKTYGFAIAATLVVFMSGEVISYHSWLQGLIYFVLGLLFMSADGVQAASPSQAPQPALAVKTA